MSKWVEKLIIKVKVTVILPWIMSASGYFLNAHRVGLFYPIVHVFLDQSSNFLNLQSQVPVFNSLVLSPAEFEPLTLTLRDVYDTYFATKAPDYYRDWRKSVFFIPHIIFRWTWYSLNWLEFNCYSRSLKIYENVRARQLVDVTDNTTRKLDWCIACVVFIQVFRCCGWFWKWQSEVYNRIFTKIYIYNKSLIRKCWCSQPVKIYQIPRNCDHSCVLQAIRVWGVLYLRGVFRTFLCWNFCFCFRIWTMEDVHV